MHVCVAVCRLCHNKLTLTLACLGVSFSLIRTVSFYDGSQTVKRNILLLSKHEVSLLLDYATFQVFLHHLGWIELDPNLFKEMQTRSLTLI